MVPGAIADRRDRHKIKVPRRATDDERLRLHTHNLVGYIGISELIAIPISRHLDPLAALRERWLVQISRRRPDFANLVELEGVALVLRLGVGLQADRQVSILVHADEGLRNIVGLGRSP